VLLELPIGEVAFETRYMFYSTLHWRPLVNGYSGGAPLEYGLWAEQLSEATEVPDVAWRAVLASRATHIVVHELMHGLGPHTITISAVGWKTYTGQVTVLKDTGADTGVIGLPSSLAR